VPETKKSKDSRFLVVSDSYDFDYNFYIRVVQLRYLEQKTSASVLAQINKKIKNMFDIPAKLSVFLPLNNNIIVSL
jgi:hypothetical protein